MQRSELRLTGLDGSNLLGFLAALGCLRVLSRVTEDDPRLSWSEGRGGRWTPTLSHPDILDRSTLVNRVSEELGIQPRKTPPDFLERWKNLPKQGHELAAYMHQMQISWPTGSPEASTAAAFLSALASVCPEQQEPIDDTAFRTMSGAGHQDFLGFMRQIFVNTSLDNVDEALFGPWRYADEGFAMRWDSTDYRPHALRAIDPSGDQTVSVRGANRLAIEALPLFPVLPGPRRNATTRFAGEARRDAAVTWPLWRARMSIHSVQSLLLCCPIPKTTSSGSSKRVQQQMRRVQAELAGQGVAAVWQSRRFTEGKFRNFTPAHRLF
jgi:hypothetical protein